MGFSRQGEAVSPHTPRRGWAPHRLGFLFHRKSGSQSSSPASCTGTAREQSEVKQTGSTEDVQKHGETTQADGPPNSAEEIPTPLAIESRSATAHSTPQSSPSSSASRLFFKGMYKRLMKKPGSRNRHRSTAPLRSVSHETLVVPETPDSPFTRVKSVHFGALVVHTYPREAQHGSSEPPLQWSQSDSSIMFIPVSERTSDGSEDGKDDYIFSSNPLAPMFLSGRSGSSASSFGSVDGRGPALRIQNDGDAQTPPGRRMPAERHLSDISEEVKSGDEEDNNSCASDPGAFPSNSFLEYHGDEFGFRHYVSSTSSRGSASTSSHASASSNSILYSFSSVVGGKPAEQGEKELENVLMGWCS
ncbi:hypothetical protein BESB_037950 [Besnoitia besnoiti]|uniref:Uncharacterized protein n=1 Tax=Besnoitia besnoiti TaxID=94643 RepID=A0A2A9MNB7_BESBE|nr:hypothetical protein BESB_037950 [Besnoitia besnoiti]PFH37337.1 hypothetical protein BESB_037950 [Besnoitia besnoiti]